jgi:hypothetical protein
MSSWATATGDSGNPSWPGLFFGVGGPDELGYSTLPEPCGSESSLPAHSLRIMARLLCPDPIESVVMIGANRVFVRHLRRRRLAAYFAYWRALGAKVEGHLNGHPAMGIRRAVAAYHMIRLAMSGAAYRLGARVNPAASLERVALLFGETIAGPEGGSEEVNSDSEPAGNRCAHR